MERIQTWFYIAANCIGLSILMFMPQNLMHLIAHWELKLFSVFEWWTTTKWNEQSNSIFTSYEYLNTKYDRTFKLSRVPLFLLNGKIFGIQIGRFISFYHVHCDNGPVWKSNVFYPYVLWNLRDILITFANVHIKIDCLYFGHCFEFSWQLFLKFKLKCYQIEFCWHVFGRLKFNFVQWTTMYDE